jgi:hypothetical protein
MLVVVVQAVTLLVVVLLAVAVVHHPQVQMEFQVRLEMEAQELAHSHLGQPLLLLEHLVVTLVAVVVVLNHKVLAQGGLAVVVLVLQVIHKQVLEQQILAVEVAVAVILVVSVEFLEAAKAVQEL